MEPRITKRASFGVKKTGYDALYKPNLSQWQKESMSDLYPMEHHGDRLPHEGGLLHVGLIEFAVLAVIVVVAVVIGVSL